jgi:Zn-dependent M28 family amino/carboxypeptidase
VGGEKGVTPDSRFLHGTKIQCRSMAKAFFALVCILPITAFTQELTALPSSESMLASTVKYLSEEIGERNYRDIEKLNKTADYIEQTFQSYGFTVKRQAFPYEGNIYYNIIAEKNGTNPAKDRMLIIGAHYDTVAGTPGADDNASGVAGLLELAWLTALKPPERTIRFVAFCLEEPPAYGTDKMGSYIYAKSVKDEGIKVLGMISLEMIGYYCHKADCQEYPLPFLGWFLPLKGNYIAFVGNLSSRALTRHLKKTFREVSSLPVESLNTFSSVTGVDFSDHRNFWEFGYKAFMVTDTSFYRYQYYHKKEDTPEKLDYKRMSELITGLHKAISKM